jgi:hypothetical protein
VVAEPQSIPVGDLYCDVGFCPMLVEDAGGAEYLIVEHKLVNRDRRTRELPLHIDGAGAAIEIAVIHQSRAAVCELRPKFSLPVGGIEPLTIDRGTVIRNRLTKLLSDAEDYKTMLPEMNKELKVIQSQMSAAKSAAQLRSNDTLNALSRRNSAIAAYNKLARALGNKSAAIDRANAVIKDKPAVQKELTSLEDVAKYAARMAAEARVSVRFYNGSDVTVPAVVK